MKDAKNLNDITAFLNEINDEINRHFEGRIELPELLASFVRFKRAYDEMESARKRIYKTLEALKNHTVPESLREHGVRNMSLESVGARVQINTRVSASMLDKVTGMEWLEENGHGGLITRTVNSSSLGAFAKELLEEGGDLPDDIFKVNIQNFASVTKI